MLNRQDDDWGVGSFDKEEAEKMVCNNTYYWRKDGYIAVIENGVCVEEILPEEFDQPYFSAYMINQCDTYQDMDDHFEELAYHAGMSDEWGAADGDNVEEIICAIFAKLGISHN